MDITVVSSPVPWWVSATSLVTAAVVLLLFSLAIYAAIKSFKWIHRWNP